MIVIDDFVKDEALKAEIKDTSSPFWDEGYNWWHGWWNENKQPPTTRHKLIQYIYATHCPPQVSGVSASGFEHWVGIFNKDKIITNGLPENEGYALNHHFDKDEGLWTRTGDVVCPKLGTIYYPDMGEEMCEGGYLKIYHTNQFIVSKDEPLRAVDSDGKDVPYELIAPVPNRLVIFNAGNLHAVTKVTSGVRYAVAINLWDDKPETDFSKERY